MSDDRPPLVPDSARSERLVLRRWRAHDAAALHPILEANFGHLAPWIPARVATPVPVPELEQRLAGFERAFDETREWRYGLFTADDEQVIGEVGLFPRDAHTRRAFADADRVEVGYWLRADVTGRGFASEATRAVLAIASALPGLTHAEIRCDARNVASAAIPRRLGFTHAATEMEPPSAPSEEPVALQLWIRKFPRCSGPGA